MIALLNEKSPQLKRLEELVGERDGDDSLKGDGNGVGEGLIWTVIGDLVSWDEYKARA